MRGRTARPLHGTDQTRTTSGVAVAMTTATAVTWRGAEEEELLPPHVQLLPQLVPPPPRPLPPSLRRPQPPPPPLPPLRVPTPVSRLMSAPWLRLLSCTLTSLVERPYRNRFGAAHAHGTLAACAGLRSDCSLPRRAANSARNDGEVRRACVRSRSPFKSLIRFPPRARAREPVCRNAVVGRVGHGNRHVPPARPRPRRHRRLVRAYGICGGQPGGALAGAG